MDGVSYSHPSALMEHHHGVGIKYLVFRCRSSLLGSDRTHCSSRCAAEGDGGQGMEKGRGVAGEGGIDDVL